MFCHIHNWNQKGDVIWKARVFIQTLRKRFKSENSHSIAKNDTNEEKVLLEFGAG